ncbi:MAG TPA: outer membrane beta-barrel protein [Pyrinomonadaceae bacterium]
MKTRALFTYAASVLALLLCASGAGAQEQDAPKFEIGVQYSSLSINLPGFRGTENAPGVGGRVTYNLNNYFAVEAEGNLFPSGTQTDYTTGGAAQQVQAGVKVGKRWQRFGIFAKARPGLVSFGDTLTPVQVESGGFTIFRFDRERKTHFSMDVGGVLEFYPSRRMVVRFDAGDTIIRYGEHAELQPIPLPSTASGIGPVGAETKHSFQFTAGVGFRFGGGTDDDGDGAPQAAPASERRFELGIQFSSLVLRPPTNGFGFPFAASGDEGSEAEAGGGARLGFNATDNLAFEVEGNFYPRRRFGINTSIGGYPAQVQAGVKYGRRFERFGVFAKARPGIVTFSSVNEVSGFESFVFDGQTFFFPTFRDTSKTYFSMDVGGVLEFYPTRRILTRFDVGDTMIRYPVRDNPSGAFVAPPPSLPAELRHNLQVTAGIGFRF